MAKKIEGIIDSDGNFHVGQPSARYQTNDGQIFLTEQLADVVDYNNFKRDIIKLFADHNRENSVSEYFIDITHSNSENSFMNEFINELFFTDLGSKFKIILETIND